MEIMVGSEEEMVALGERLAKAVRPGDVIALIGELGSGKTTLVRGLARGLGYAGRVTSPTFTLMNIYEGKMPVFHCDFYRLEGESIDDLGVEDYAGREGLFVIEWPQVVATDITATLNITIEILDDYDGPRRVSMVPAGPRGGDIVKEMNEYAHSGS